MERAVETTFGGAEKVKVQAADTLEEAARKLREMSITAKGEDVKAILSDTEARIDELRGQVSKKVEPVEDFITEHPFVSIALAAGVGLMIGALLTRRD